MRPDSAQSYFNLARAERVAQHDEVALTASETALRLKHDPDISEASWATIRPLIECTAAGLKGDYQQAVESCGQAATLPDVAGTHIQARLLQLTAFAGLHDGTDLRDASADLVTHTAHRSNQDPIVSEIDLAPQIVDVDVHHIGHGIEVELPDLLDNRGARHRLPFMPHQELEKLELAVGQLDLSLAPPDLAGVGV